MLFAQIKTASNLKMFVESGTDSYFFTRSTMRFFGDTMRNYGVRHLTPGTIELYRRRPVKHGLFNSAFFQVSADGCSADRFHPRQDQGDCQDARDEREDESVERGEV